MNGGSSMDWRAGWRAALDGGDRWMEAVGLGWRGLDGGMEGGAGWTGWRAGW